MSQLNPVRCLSQMSQLNPASIDSELNFENHISNICSKVSKNLNALGRIAGYITLVVQGIY